MAALEDRIDQQTLALQGQPLRLRVREIENLRTEETDTSLALKPNGAGGVAFGPGSGGGYFSGAEQTETHAVYTPGTHVVGSIEVPQTAGAPATVSIDGCFTGVADSTPGGDMCVGQAGGSMIRRDDGSWGAPATATAWYDNGHGAGFIDGVAVVAVPDTPTPGTTTLEFQATLNVYAAQLDMAFVLNWKLFASGIPIPPP